MKNISEYKKGNLKKANVILNIALPLKSGTPKVIFLSFFILFSYVISPPQFLPPSLPLVYPPTSSLPQIYPLLPLLRKEPASEGHPANKAYQTTINHVSSPQGWIRQFSRRKRVPEVRDRVRECLHPHYQKPHKLLCCNIYVEDLRKTPKGSMISASSHESQSVDSVDYVLLVSLIPMITLILPALLHRTPLVPLSVWLLDSASAPINFRMKSLWFL